MRVTTVAGDITTDAVRAALLQACPAPDILVNNAGGPPPGDFRQWDREVWLRALDANMLTPIFLIKAIVDGMIARKFGRIVNITSVSVKSPIESLGLSNGARAGLTGFIAGLSRKTVAHNVTINNILPGPFDTDRLRSNIESQARATGKPLRAGRPRAPGPEPGGTLRHRGGVRRGVRVRLQRPGRLHHRAELRARRRRVPGDPVAATFVAGPMPAKGEPLRAPAG